MPSATPSSSGSGSPPSPSPAASSRTSRPWTAAALVLLLLLLLTGCNSHPADDQSDNGTARIGADEARALEQRILNQRARAVREHRPALFLRSVDHHDKDLMARQRQYYLNLVQLPLAAFRYQVRPAQWEGQRLLSRWGRDVRIPQVTLSLELQGYDAVPVQRTVGFVFSFADGKATIVSDRTAAGTRLFLGTPAPWDLTAISVRQTTGVLGIFDSVTAPAGDKLVRGGTAGHRRPRPAAAVHLVRPRGRLQRLES